MLLLEKQVHSLYKPPLNSKHLHSQIVAKITQHVPKSERCKGDYTSPYNTFQTVLSVDIMKRYARRWLQPIMKLQHTSAMENAAVVSSEFGRGRFKKRCGVKKLFQTPVSLCTSLMTLGMSSSSHLEFHFCSLLVELTKPIYK